MQYCVKRGYHNCCEMNEFTAHRIFLQCKHLHNHCSQFNPIQATLFWSSCGQGGAHCALLLKIMFLLYKQSTVKFF